MLDLLASSKKRWSFNESHTKCNSNRRVYTKSLYMEIQVAQWICLYCKF